MSDIKTSTHILGRLRKHGPPIEIRFEYIEEHKEWEVNLRNRDLKQVIGDWRIWGTGRAFELNDAISLAFNEAERRGYQEAKKTQSGRWSTFKND